MRRLVYFILAFIVWVFLTWPFADGRIDIQVIIAGLIASLIVAILFHEILPQEHTVFISPIRIFWVIIYGLIGFVYGRYKNKEIPNN